jgi:Arc/MetJ-type ribon-helix-helix transcriptional regulator
MSETEKITINLGPVDLGQIDLLVREGFYSNRTDFIRTAIRNQLATHAEAVRQTVARQTLVLGVQHFSRRDLEAVRDAGEPAPDRGAGAGEHRRRRLSGAGPRDYRVRNRARRFPGEPGCEAGAGGPYRVAVSLRHHRSTIQPRRRGGFACRTRRWEQRRAARECRRGWVSRVASAEMVRFFMENSRD